MDKKGQAIQQIQGLIIPIIAIGIILAVGFLIFGEVKEKAIDMGDSMSILNNTITIVNNTFVTINTTCVFERDISVTEVWNGSGGHSVKLDTGNYTVIGWYINVSCVGVTTPGNKCPPAGGAMDISYTCLTGGYAVEGTRTIQEATDTIPGWLPIIIITIIGSILIGLVSMFRKR